MPAIVAHQRQHVVQRLRGRRHRGGAAVLAADDVRRVEEQPGLVVPHALAACRVERGLLHVVELLADLRVVERPEACLLLRLRHGRVQRRRQERVEAEAVDHVVQLGQVDRQVADRVAVDRRRSRRRRGTAP